MRDTKFIVIHMKCDTFCMSICYFCSQIFLLFQILFTTKSVPVFEPDQISRTIFWFEIQLWICLCKKICVAQVAKHFTYILCLNTEFMVNLVLVATGRMLDTIRKRNIERWSMFLVFTLHIRHTNGMNTKNKYNIFYLYPIQSNAQQTKNKQNIDTWTTTQLKMKLSFVWWKKNI